MRAPHSRSSQQARYAVLLAALLGGVAALSVVFFAPSWPGRSNLRSLSQIALAAGGHPPASAMPSACAPGNQDIFGKDFVVDAQQWLCGHVTVYGGSATILGHVDGDVVAAGGSVIVSGEVGGRVLALGGDVSLLTGARVRGDVQAVGGTVHAAPGVTVGGQIDRGIITDQFTLPNITTIIPVRLEWADVLFWVFSGLIISLFLPSQLLRVRLMARRQPLGSLFLGLLAYLVGLIAALVLVLSCLGIPLAFAIGVVLWGGSIFGTAALGLWLGSALVPGALGYRRFPFVLATVLGVTMLAIASTAPIIGSIIRLLVSTAGLGAVLLTIATMRHPSPARRRALV